LKQKGTVIAMKGEVDDEETKRLMGAEGIQYRLQKTIPLVLPFSTFKRTLVLFEKS
jgi:hypothetical protein